MIDLMPALGLGCALLGVTVQPCDSRVSYYEPQAQQVPAAHLAMIASISLWDMPNGDAGPISKTIRLPATEHSDPAILSHEVGHCVMATLGLNEPYAARFWADGRPVGLTTPYGRTDALEDAAESYSAIVHDWPWLVSAERVQWLRERAFGGRS